MSSKKLQIQEDVTPNLIPMIDIMFLLLLFFMLGADMGQREFEELLLPKAISVKDDTKEKGGDKSRVTINVYHRYSSDIKCALYANRQVCREPNHWRVGIKGHDYTDAEKLGGILDREAAPLRGQDPKNPKISERKVMIRADTSAPYSLVQGAMHVCTKQGIYRIECGAARPDETRKRG